MSPMDTTRSSAGLWARLSRDYEAKVLSLTSLSGVLVRLIDSVRPGIIVDAGCGPLGLLPRALAALPGSRAVGVDFSEAMIVQSKRSTQGSGVRHVLSDLRQLALRDASVDTIVAVNSFIPETRAEVEAMFQEAARVLRRGGRLVAVLPAFEMSLVARDEWGMAVRLDVEERREWETTGWQCFYTTDDVAGLMARHRFARHRLERLALSADDALAQVRVVYASQLEGVPPSRIRAAPLFEHFLVAER